jgi:prevent-host-death family protein
MSKASWSIAEAKAKFSEVVRKAEHEGPQEITRHGQETAVLVSKTEWDRKSKRKGTLAEFFANSPLRGSGIVIPARRKSGWRIEL